MVYVPVNEIHFDTVFLKFKTLDENATVFCTVILFIVLYFVILLYARRQDKNDVLRWKASPLLDNNPDDKYEYEVTVCTGLRLGASTRSNIAFSLHGGKSSTGERCLMDNGKKKFLCGSVNRYKLTVPECLGDLFYLRIWHDSSGRGSYASWYLERVYVTDIQTNQTNFSRVQRLSCCLSLIFSAMLTNAMFYKTRDDEEVRSDPILTEMLGLIYVATISALIVLPVNMVIVKLFRKSGNAKLSQWFAYIAWTITIIVTLVSSFFIILYSMEWGPIQSEKWLLSFITSYFESTCLVDPIKAIFIAVIISILTRRSDKLDADLIPSNETSDVEAPVMSDLKNDELTSVKSTSHILDEEEASFIRRRRDNEKMMDNILRVQTMNHFLEWIDKDIAPSLYDNETPYKFTALLTVSGLYDGYNTMMALSMFFFIVRYLELLRFNKRMALLAMTLRNARDDIKGFFIFFLLILTAFAHMGYEMFGSYIDVFSTMAGTMGYLVTVLVGSHRYFNTIMTALGASGKLFLFIFATFNITVTINIFVGIMTSAFQDARMENKHKKNSFEMLQYMKTCLEDILYMHFNIDISTTRQNSGERKTEAHTADSSARVGELFEDMEKKLDKIIIQLDNID
ncbi:uncharacterized protein LOC144355610 [Saccoglossus kowalevskii]